MASNTPYQPEGYQSVIPYLHVNGAARLIAFMKDVFNAQEIAVYSRPDGTVGHAALRVGDSVIELADVSPEWPAMPCALQVYVPDADARPIIARSKPGQARFCRQRHSSTETAQPVCVIAQATTGTLPLKLK
jgi:hypothetical protein